MKKQQGKPTIEEHQNQYNWDAFDIRYYRDLDFDDIQDSILAYTKKRTISLEEATSTPYFSKAYIHTDGKLLRLDQIGTRGVPSQVYIEYSSNLPVKALEYYLGINPHGKRITLGGELSREWDYKYDENGRLIEMTEHTYPDLAFTYRYTNHLYLHRFYEYDQDGLLRTYQLVEGLSISGKPWQKNKVIIYNREKAKILSNNTVSKVALISKNQLGKNTNLFRFGGLPPREVFIPVCPKCNENPAYIGLVDLSKPLQKKRISLNHIPIFFCLKCMENQTISMRQAQHQILDGNIKVFPETDFSFVNSSDEETNETAFVKLGGFPNWIQNEEYPKCNECSNPMIFVCQIESNEHLYNGQDALMFGDLGKLYVFACCNSVTTIMQCY